MENTDILNVQLAIQKDRGHYILNDIKSNAENLEGKIFAVRFDKILDPSYPSFLSSDGIKNYPLYNSDGDTFLSLSDLNNSVVLLTFNNKKWQLVKTIYRTLENVGHILVDENGQTLPNRQVLKIKNFKMRVDNEDNTIELVNPIWTQPVIEGIKGVINEYQWVSLYGDAFNAPVTGVYRVTVNLCLNNIIEPSREVGIRVGNREDWFPQLKRLRHSFIIVGNFKQGDSLVPEVYVDKMSTSDTINIEESNFCIECLNTLEL